MNKMQFLELVVVILLITNAMLMNRISRLEEDLDSTKEQTEIFLNDLANRVKENKNK